MKFLNIHKQDKKYSKNLINDFKKNINKGDFILGKSVETFEKIC